MPGTVGGNGIGASMDAPGAAGTGIAGLGTAGAGFGADCGVGVCATAMAVHSKAATAAVSERRKRMGERISCDGWICTTAVIA